MENNFNPYPYCDVNYRTLNGNSQKSDNLLSTKNGEICVQPMWRMELLGKYYGIDIYEYEDNTNWELYFEKTCNCNTLTNEEREEIDHELYRPDRFDEYFEHLAEVAAEVGCQRAEIKCLIKSLILKYRSNRIANISQFPHKQFSKLYTRLVSSNDTEQLRVAKRLSRYHVKQLSAFLRFDLMNKTTRGDGSN